MEADLDGKNCQTIKEDTSANDLFKLLSTSFLPKQNHILDQPLEADVFKHQVKKCEDNFEKLISVLENQSDSKSINKKLVINIILLCGEHSKDELWTTCQTVAYAEQLLRLVIAKRNCKSVIDLLMHYKIDLIFDELRPKLLKNTWKDNPAAVTCFMWLLFHIKCPHLGDVLNSVLPTCLLLIDDHVYSNKIKGLQCLEHLANNVDLRGILLFSNFHQYSHDYLLQSRAELNQFGRGSVIYNALEHMIYLREPEVIPPLGACLTALLSKIEHGPSAVNLSWSHFDDVLNIWLPSMEMEQKLLLREAYIGSLSDLLQAMGLASVRWSKKLLGILSEYCEQDHTRDKAISTLLTFMKTTWPRLSLNFQPIVIILMKVVIKIAKNSASGNSSQSSLKLIKQCFTLLETVCHLEYDSFVKDMKNCGEMEDCFLLITDQGRRDL